MLAASSVLGELSRSVMKIQIIIAILLCLSTGARAFTVFNFPNFDWKISVSGKQRKKISENEKNLRELIESSLSPLKAYSLLQLKRHLGPESDLPDHFRLPSYYYSGLTLAGSQINGDPHFHFFSIGDDSGLVVLQLSGNPSISGGAIYFHQDRVDDKSAFDEEIIRSILKSISDRIPTTEQESAPNP